MQLLWIFAKGYNNLGFTILKNCMRFHFFLWSLFSVKELRFHYMHVVVVVFFVYLFVCLCFLLLLFLFLCLFVFLLSFTLVFLLVRSTG